MVSHSSHVEKKRSLGTDFNSFGILVLGRLLGGVSTSLLYSVFDTWLIRSHNDAQLKQYLGKSFTVAAYGKSLIAIVAGFVADQAAGQGKVHAIYGGGLNVGGYLNTIDVALCTSLLCGFLAYVMWEENFGDTDSSSHVERCDAHWYDGLKIAFQTTVRSTDILLCGIISSLYEGSMYVRSCAWVLVLLRV
jgi:MFS transporter, MFS domain-containing protein family, molybdate-anion transporter